jgi:hypothetical protein
MTQIRTNGVSFTYKGAFLPICMEDQPTTSEPTKWCLENIGAWNKDWTRRITTNSKTEFGEVQTVITYFFEDADIALQFKLSMNDLKFDTIVDAR